MTPPSPPRRDRPASITYAVGSTGTGKTWYVKRRLEAHRGRVLLWDWKADHDELPAAGLGDVARELAAGAAAVRHVPDCSRVPERFALFCQMAWAVQVADPATDCLFIVEELAEVTQPNYAPPWWRRICAQGRVYGFDVIGTTQRPAHVDKSFTGNATLIRVGRLGEWPDARDLGRRINVDPARIQALPDGCAFTFDGRKTTLTKPRP